MLREGLAGMLDLFFPRTCLCCGAALMEGERCLCLECESRLPRTMYHHYWRGPGTMNPMEERIAGVVPFEHAMPVFFYKRDSPLAQLIQDFKYRGFASLAVELGRVAGHDFVECGVLEGVDMLVPVPLHRSKKASRGYSQTRLIADGISEVSGVPVVEVLTAIRAHRTQTSLSAEERRRNAQGVFLLDNPDICSGKHLAIVDDICTTGSTLVSAAEACRTQELDIRLSFLTLGVTF